jgi:hypothetical protein
MASFHTKLHSLDWAFGKVPSDDGQVLFACYWLLKICPILLLFE